MFLRQSLISKSTLSFQQLVRYDSSIPLLRPVSLPTFYLGLDVNSNSTGFTVLDSFANVLDCGIIDTSNKIDMNDAGIIFEKEFVNIKQRILRQKSESLEWSVTIEDFMKSFGAGRWQTRSLFTLAQINCIASYQVYRTFGVRSKSIHSTIPRSYFGLKKPKNTPNIGGDSAIKSVVFNFLYNIYPHNSWLLSFDGTPSKKSFDLADSHLIALYSLFSQIEYATMYDPVVYGAYDKNNHHSSVTNVQEIIEKLSKKKKSLYIQYLRNVIINQTFPKLQLG